jgi:hypothetical protein
VVSSRQVIRIFCIYAFFIILTCATYPFQLILFDLIFLIIFHRIQIMKLHIMQFSSASCHLRPFRPNIIFSTLFSNTINLRSSHCWVRDQVSHSYNTTHIVVLYILNCRISCRNRTTASIHEFNLLLASCCMSFDLLLSFINIKILPYFRNTCFLRCMQNFILTHNCTLQAVIRSHGCHVLCGKLNVFVCVCQDGGRLRYLTACP